MQLCRFALLESVVWWRARLHFIVFASLHLVLAACYPDRRKAKEEGEAERKAHRDKLLWLQLLHVLECMLRGLMYLLKSV